MESAMPFGSFEELKLIALSCSKTLHLGVGKVNEYDDLIFLSIGIYNYTLKNYAETLKF